MKIIVAADSRWGIGKNNKLLVSIPSDMRFFRETTSGCTIIMGRKTLESFPGGRPLKNRRNIVLTSDPNCVVPGAEVAHSVQEALELIRDEAPDRVFCIGGGSIYRQFLPHCDTAYVTKIDHVYEADSYFPDLDADEEWEITSQSEEQTYFDLTFHFLTYTRRRKG